MWLIIVVEILLIDLLLIQKTLNLVGAAGGLLRLVAVYLWQREESGILGGISFMLASVGLVGVIGFLFTDAFVFSFIDPQLQAELTNGSTDRSIFASVLLYVFGVVLI